jgi:hypothetical protein
LFNPNTGVYADYESLETLKNDLPKVILEFYLHHCHNNPYSVVTINEDGSETWATPSDNKVDLEKVLEKIRQNL